MQKADVFRRFIALAIDNLICLCLSMVPRLGGLLGITYLLLRDGFPWKFMPYRSFGKSVTRLQVLTTSGKLPVPGFNYSIKRNWVLAFPALVSQVPVIGFALALPLGLLICLIEGIKLITNERGQRFGDLWAKTQVVVDGSLPEAGASLYD